MEEIRSQKQDIYCLNSVKSQDIYAFHSCAMWQDGNDQICLRRENRASENHFMSSELWEMLLDC